MPLTIQQDGSVVGGQPNTVVATWWNDYHDLLTGAMTDQDVTLHTDLILGPLGANPAAPTATAQAGAGLGIGSYTYAVTFVKQGQSGESLTGTTVNVTTTSGNQAVGLSAIPTGPTGTVARNIYRSKVGGGALFFVAQLANNTATTYADTTSDASLTVGAPGNNNFGGRLILKNGAGVVMSYLLEDGSLSVGNSISFGPAVSGSQAQLIYYTPNDAVQLIAPAAGASALGIAFGVWTGSNTTYPFSIGGQIVGAPAYVGSSGDLHDANGRVAVQGSHSSGQPALSYGAGAPAALATNEIYIQTS